MINERHTVLFFGNLAESKALGSLRVKVQNPEEVMAWAGAVCHFGGIRILELERTF